MSSLTRAIQGLILFSTVLGLIFLWQAYPLLPTDAFDFVSLGWVLFAVDSALTFARPNISYYLGLVLAVLALASTLSQPAHFALVASGNLLASATIILGSIAEILLIVLAAYYIVTERRKNPWAWPGEQEGLASETEPESADQM
jgi:hypothetical protein